MVTRSRILYVEDDETLGFITSENLERKGYEVILCKDGESAYRLFKTESFDLCLFDVMLPKLDGFTLARLVRKENEEIPIIFISAKTLTEDKIEGLLLGADDYLVKPFNIEELTLKIEVFLRRSRVNKAESPESEIRIGSCTLDMGLLRLECGGIVKKLTFREAELISYFSRNRNKLLSREQILEAVWGGNDYFSGRSLDVFISRLRKYFQDDKLVSIENRHGLGYVFEVK
ncbi:MAG TPA: response regulator transcription factor [Bacteroidales bacterium]|nr:response regulator transcription factor [Bacteroidales bacterium]HOX78911.1 response regulator transcription factor [Bacteroidales bacterium]HPI85048.1 response regulator transcription factor [Bacteroidales bacterium]HPM92504.1 response regulator transcription factor [Bacteroidales bacterium]